MSKLELILAAGAFAIVGFFFCCNKTNKDVKENDLQKQSKTDTIYITKYATGTAKKVPHTVIFNHDTVYFHDSVVVYHDSTLSLMVSHLDSVSPLINYSVKETHIVDTTTITIHDFRNALQAGVVVGLNTIAPSLSYSSRTVTFTGGYNLINKTVIFGSYINLSTFGSWKLRNGTHKGKKEVAP